MKKFTVAFVVFCAAICSVCSFRCYKCGPAKLKQCQKENIEIHCPENRNFTCYMKWGDYYDEAGDGEIELFTKGCTSKSKCQEEYDQCYNETVKVPGIKWCRVYCCDYGGRDGTPPCNGVFTVSPDKVTLVMFATVYSLKLFY